MSRKPLLPATRAYFARAIAVHAAYDAGHITGAEYAAAVTANQYDSNLNIMTIPAYAPLAQGPRLPTTEHQYPLVTQHDDCDDYASCACGVFAFNCVCRDFA